MDMNSLPKTVFRECRDCDLNPGPSASESSTLTARLPSHYRTLIGSLALAIKRNHRVAPMTFDTRRGSGTFWSRDQYAKPPSARAEVLCACLSVRTHISETTLPIFGKFVRILSGSVARSCCGAVAIRSVLPDEGIFAHNGH